MVWLSPSR
jgi:hypothetical protein